MGIKEIEYGSLASSSDLNTNFRYLEEELQNLADLIVTKAANFSSVVMTLNSSVNEVLERRSSFFQVGMIIGTLTETIPEGFLLCDGSELAVDEYQELYDVIGNKYGGTVGLSFCLPDLTDKTLWGSGNSAVGTVLTSKLPNIKGQFRLEGTEGSSAVSGVFSSSSKGGKYGYGHETGAVNPLMKFNANNYCDVYSDNITIVQPPSLVVHYVIRY